jgi:exocyst complex protein 7
MYVFPIHPPSCVSLFHCGERNRIHLLTHPQAEYERLASLALLTTPQQLKQTYTALLAPVLKNLTTITSTLITIIKKDLPRYTFLALCLFTVLQPLQAPWENAIGSRVIADDGVGGEFKETLTTLRGICVRSFPEVLVDVQSAALGSGSGPGGETSVGTSVAGITKQVRLYLN